MAVSSPSRFLVENAKSRKHRLLCPWARSGSLGMDRTSPSSMCFRSRSLPLRKAFWSSTFPPAETSVEAPPKADFGGMHRTETSILCRESCSQLGCTGRTHGANKDPRREGTGEYACASSSWVVRNTSLARVLTSPARMQCAKLNSNTSVKQRAYIVEATRWAVIVWKAWNA